MNASPDLLFADTLVKRFGALLATDHATLRVARGEIHALIGPNGAGKTTLIHQLAGTLSPDSGRIHFDGQDVSARPIHQRAHLGLVRSYQITNVFLRLTVLDNLALALLAHEKGSLLAWWRPARLDRQRYGEALALAQRVGLGEQAQSLVSTLSHGQRRQLEVGLALALKPKLLLLDEPMAGMGPDESARMLALLQSLKGETTMLLVEHDMDAVFRLAGRISVLVFGKIIASGTPDEIRQHAQVRRAYLGDELEQTP